MYWKHEDNKDRKLGEAPTQIMQTTQLLSGDSLTDSIYHEFLYWMVFLVFLMAHLAIS
jgi:hypothetical protein